MFTSKRLTFRAIEEEDVDVFRAIKEDIEGTINSSPFLLKPGSKADTIDFRDWVIKNAVIGVVICLTPLSNTETPVPIGQIHLRGPPKEFAHHRHGEIGINMLKPYQGKGYGTEAINWMLNWAFKIAGLHRVEIRTFSWNEGSLRLYQRMGFVLEGRMREQFWLNGSWGDEICLGMLDREWDALQQKENDEDRVLTTREKQ